MICQNCGKKTNTQKCSSCGEILSPTQLIYENAQEIEGLFAVDIPKAEKFGRYQIIEELGQGGMGMVYKAYDPHLERTVALKLMLSGKNSKPKEIARFLREAKATAQLKHSGIVTIYDIGQENNQPFFAMEYLEGVSLKEYLKKSHSSLHRKVEILKQVAQAVAYAHKKGIIHRDLKPANIMMVDKQAKVMDFGLAKVQKASRQLSQSGMVIGTLQYMPPEQAEGKIRDVDERSDIYSLGAILYEIMTGIPPFDGDSLSQILYQVLHKNPIPPTKLQKRNPSRQLEKICLKALAKKKDRRYENMEEFIAALDNFLEGRKEKYNRLSKKSYALIGLFILCLVCFFIRPEILFPSLSLPQKEESKKLTEVNKKTLSPQNQEPQKTNSPEIINIPTFAYQKTTTYSTESQTYEVKEFLHEKTEIEFVLIPGGSFLMGSTNYSSEKPKHKVYLKPFLMSKYEVTQAQWQTVMKSTVFDYEGDNIPVRNVTWSEAKQFCSQNGFVLPSEAQWEYAYKGGSTTKYYWGDKPHPDYLNFDSEGPIEVGQKKPNAFGLFDMSGNLYEWCEDKWNPHYMGAPQDGRPWNTQKKSDSKQVIRGGSWYHDADRSISTRRTGHLLSKGYNYVGFRCVFNLDQKLSHTKKSSLKETNLKKIPNFRYIQRITYSEGGKTHTVDEYLHEQTEVKFVLIHGGSFLMGSKLRKGAEEHKVNVQSFLLSKYEVTQGLWEKIMNTSPWKGRQFAREGETYAANHISWTQAKDFCRKTSLRLPSEAEWEYACRSGTTTEFYWGNKDIADYAWYANTAFFKGKKYPHPIGQKKPNAFGLYDMGGNVFEWCEDGWHENYSGAPTNGSAWHLDGPFKIIRGGSFGSPTPEDCSSTKRGRGPTDGNDRGLGFRLACTPANN